MNDDEAQYPLFGFISAIKSGASIASKTKFGKNHRCFALTIGKIAPKMWYSFLTKYAAQHYPPKDERERLTLFLLFSCEAGHIKVYLNKYKTEIINKYVKKV